MMQQYSVAAVEGGGGEIETSTGANGGDGGGEAGKEPY